MDPEQQTAADYYLKHRKRSLFSRITILSCMGVLLLVLAVNMSVLYSNDQSTIRSNASAPQSLPSLPVGCEYQHENGNVKIQCFKPTPTITTIVPMNADLPPLPPECTFAASTIGYKLLCNTVNIPIPTVPVILPANCTAAIEHNSANCKDNSNQTTTVKLPSLPHGCSYTFAENQYYVVCEAK